VRIAVTAVYRLRRVFTFILSFAVKDAVMWHAEGLERNVVLSGCCDCKSSKCNENVGQTPTIADSDELTNGEGPY
jgi:hypothetical protein